MLPLHQRPFRPFRLVMSSGQTYDVRHPEMALLMQTDLLVGTSIADDGVPAEFKVCSLLHVAAIEPHNGSAARANPAGSHERVCRPGAVATVESVASE